MGGGVERGMVDGVARLGRVFTFRTYGFHALRTLAARFAVFGIPLGADRALEPELSVNSNLTVFPSFE